MPEPTLTQVFGVNCSQTATDLIISKADLAEVGLTASVDNRAESLFVALLLKVMNHLNPANQEINPAMQITVDTSFPSIIFRNDQNYRQNTYTIALQKPDAGAVIDPDDY